MCDTFAKIIEKEKYAIFGKNSDREKEECQIVQFIPAKSNINKYLKTTYIEIEQVKNTASIFISKPYWMWGAEMGVNEYGVCIGNEALYSNQYNNPNLGLLGMDLVRLGLERGKTAHEALCIIIDLLEKYGQGGYCSLKNKDLYDNAFLIMDIKDCFILETKNKHWQYKKVKYASISNIFSIRHPDEFSDLKNFKRLFEKKGKHSGDYRKKLMQKPIKKLSTIEEAINILRMHNKIDNDPLVKKKSVCMHGEYRTTGSMCVELKRGEKPKIFFTATPHPCQSLFLPFTFGEKIANPINNENEQDTLFWENHSKLLNKTSICEEKLKYFQHKIISQNLSLEDSLHIRNQIFN